MLIAGRFLLADPVGQGEVGSLWRARDQVLGRDVSVEEVPLPSQLTGEERARMMRETRTAASMHHPGVITIYDVLDQDGALWIVTELISGVSLATEIARDGRLPWRRVAEIGVQVAEAMSHAHVRGIVHGTLNPGRILLSGDRAMVIGFGTASIANASWKLTGAGGRVEAPGYLAPEQVEGTGAGPAADMWALGAALYAAAEGVPPFDGATLTATLTQILAADPRPAEHAGPLWELLATLLAKDPRQRPFAWAVARVLSDYRLETPELGQAAPSTVPIERSAIATPAPDDRPAGTPWWENVAPSATAPANPEPATPSPAVTAPPLPKPTQLSPLPQPASQEPVPFGQPPPPYGRAGGKAAPPAPASARRPRRPTIPRKKKTPSIGPPSAPSGAPAPAPQAGGHPAQPTDRLSRTVRSLVQQGLLVFNPPEEMRQGITDRIEVGIARSADFREALSEGLRGRGQPRYEEIETSSLMTVELRGDAFQVTSYSTPEQVVAPAARWEFDVRPTRAGQQTLTLCVCLRLTGREFDPLGGGRRSVPVLERSIRIRVSMAYSTRRFVAGNWQWLIATVAGLGGGIAAWIALFH
jgi:serine/threonine protein kinase